MTSALMKLRSGDVDSGSLSELCRWRDVDIGIVLTNGVVGGGGALERDCWWLYVEMSLGSIEVEVGSVGS